MSRLRTWTRYGCGVLYLAAGVNHFVSPDFYVRMMPPSLPWPRELVAISGAAEILLGALLLPAATSRLAAWGLIALLIAVFPANLQMALHPKQFPEFSPTALWGRLPVQGLLIVWAWWYTRPVGHSGSNGKTQRDGPSSST
jgi:uncharacterized membrane protein